MIEAQKALGRMGEAMVNKNRPEFLLITDLGWSTPDCVELDYGGIQM
jgi:hypothetical protein